MAPKDDIVTETAKEFHDTITDTLKEIMGPLGKDKDDDDRGCHCKCDKD